MTPMIAISDRAQQEIRNLSDAPEKFLRIWVTEGGCAGMTYQASIDETATPFDSVVFDANQVKVVANRSSAQHLNGLQVDYSDDLIKMGFRFSNSLASKACGCGASFAV